MGFAQVHRHIDVVAMCLVSGAENGFVHARIARINYNIGFDFMNECLNGFLIARINLFCNKFCSVIEQRNCFLCT